MCVYTYYVHTHTYIYIYKFYQNGKENGQGEPFLGVTYNYGATIVKIRLSPSRFQAKLTTFVKFYVAFTRELHPPRSVSESMVCVVFSWLYPPSNSMEFDCVCWRFIVFFGSCFFAKLVFCQCQHTKCASSHRPYCDFWRVSMLAPAQGDANAGIVCLASTLSTPGRHFLKNVIKQQHPRSQHKLSEC